MGLLGAVPGGPPWKRKAVPLTGPAIMRPKPETTPAPAKEDRKAAIVTARSKAASAIVQRDVKPGNDNRPAGPKSRIVQAAKPKRRRKVWAQTARRPRQKSRP